MVVSFWEQGVLPLQPSKMQNHIGNHKEKNWIVNKQTKAQRKRDGRNDPTNLSEQIRKAAYFCQMQTKIDMMLTREGRTLTRIQT